MQSNIHTLGRAQLRFRNAGPRTDNANGVEKNDRQGAIFHPKLDILARPGGQPRLEVKGRLSRERITGTEVDLAFFHFDPGYLVETLTRERHLFRGVPYVDEDGQTQDLRGN